MLFEHFCVAGKENILVKQTASLDSDQVRLYLLHMTCKYLKCVSSLHLNSLA